MSKNEFEIGDTVKRYKGFGTPAFKSHNLEKNGIYTIVGFKGNYLKLEGLDSRYNHRHFKKVNTTYTKLNKNYNI